VPTITRTKALMTNLLYPAFLGTYMVSVSLAFSDLGGDRAQISFFLLLYFVLAFLESIVLEQNYGIWNFLVDATEIGLMTLAFVVLGLNEPQISKGTSTQFWAILTVLFFLPYVSRFPKRRNWMFDHLCTAAMLIALLATYQLLDQVTWSIFGGLLHHWPFLKNPDDFLLTISDQTAHSFLWVLMTLYLIALVVDASNTTKDKVNTWKKPLKENLSYVIFTLPVCLLFAVFAVVRGLSIW